jgi:hypothetical protein
MNTILSRFKERWELYLFFAIGAGTIFMKVWGVGDEVQLVKEDVAEVKMVQQRLIENKIDSDLLDAKLDPLIQSNDELKREMNITQANINGLRTASLAGAEERAHQLEGRMIIIQDMVYNNSITAKAAVESLSVLSYEIEEVRRLAAIPDTHIVTKTDTLEVKKKGFFSKLNPFD